MKLIGGPLVGICFNTMDHQFHGYISKNSKDDNLVKLWKQNIWQLTINDPSWMCSNNQGANDKKLSPADQAY